MEAHAAVGALPRLDGLDLDLGLRERQRVAHRDKVARALGGHDAGHAGTCQDVALLGTVLKHHGLGLGVHEDGALGHGLALGHRLVGHVHHAHVALLVDVGELITVRVAGHLLILCHRYQPPI